MMATEMVERQGVVRVFSTKSSLVFIFLLYCIRSSATENKQKDAKHATRAIFDANIVLVMHCRHDTIDTI